MLLSKLNFYSELKSCGHWWLAWGKLNATWNFVYKLFYWHLSAVKTLIKWLHDTWDVHSCLFHFKLVVKRKGWSRSLALRTAIWTEAFIQHSVSLHQRAPKLFIVWISWTNWHNLKDETLFLIKKKQYNEVPLNVVFVLYTCVPNQKTVPKNFGANTITPLLPIHIYAYNYVCRHTVNLLWSVHGLTLTVSIWWTDYV